MSRLPREAREGLRRARLEILRERHPNVTWVALEQKPYESESTRVNSLSSDGEPAEDELLAAVA